MSHSPSGTFSAPTFKPKEGCQGCQLLLHPPVAPSSSQPPPTPHLVVYISTVRCTLRRATSPGFSRQAGKPVLRHSASLPVEHDDRARPDPVRRVRDRRRGVPLDD